MPGNVKADHVIDIIAAILISGGQSANQIKEISQVVVDYLKNRGGVMDAAATSTESGSH